MRTILAGLILVVSIGVLAQNKYQPMNVKVGLWEVTRTVTTGGDMAMPTGMMAKLSPEQRARMEERMKARSAANNDTQTYKSCLTKEELQQGPAFDKEMKECSKNILTSASDRAELQYSCEVEGVPVNGTVQVQALSPEQVKGSSHGSANINGHTMSTGSTFTAKWIGADCGTTR